MTTNIILWALGHVVLYLVPGGDYFWGVNCCDTTMHVISNQICLDHVRCLISI
jgi:hypothetical protein